MCSRYKSLEAKDIRPGDETIVYTVHGPQSMRWGFSMANKKLLINARSETAMTKNLFKNAISNTVPTERRILVLTSGYYEWKSDEENHQKQKYHISLGQGSPMLLCGLEADQPDGTRRHVILTTAASGVCADIHHRMPLICPREEMRQWLYDTDFAVKKLKDTRVDDLTLACS